MQLRQLLHQSVHTPLLPSASSQFMSVAFIFFLIRLEAFEDTVKTHKRPYILNKAQWYFSDRDCVFQGKGLFARRSIRKGETIFFERPVVSAQFLWNSLYKYKGNTISSVGHVHILSKHSCLMVLFHANNKVFAFNNAVLLLKEG